MVLRRAPHHRRAADIDILDDFVAARALGHGLRKRIEIDHHQVDGADAMFLHRRQMFGIVAHRQQPAMHFGMQRLHPPVHHFGKAGEFADIHDLQPGCAKRFCSATSRDQFDMPRYQRMTQFDQPRLVRH